MTTLNRRGLTLLETIVIGIIIIILAAIIMPVFKNYSEKTKSLTKMDDFRNVVSTQPSLVSFEQALANKGGFVSIKRRNDGKRISSMTYVFPAEDTIETRNNLGDAQMNALKVLRGSIVLRPSIKTTTSGGRYVEVKMSMS